MALRGRVCPLRMAMLIDTRLLAELVQPSILSRRWEVVAAASRECGRECGSHELLYAHLFLLKSAAFLRYNHGGRQ
eukprot:SAG22_NODE_1404_length_4491_cov_3.411885_5_plen_76_part_00